MRVGWLDATIGVSGDMVLGALVDLGVDMAHLQEHLDRLELGIELSSERVQRSGLVATKVHVEAPGDQHLRHLPEILELFERLEPAVRERAGSVFVRLAEAEAAVHDIAVDQVHFHEVGALDSIADIVGAAAGLESLGLDRIAGSTIGLGSGHAKTQHGQIPVPVPAVLELTRGLPTAGGPAPFESATPTGAALMVAAAQEWGPMPTMAVERIGIGAGTLDPKGIANVFRIVVGNQIGATTDALRSQAVRIDANVDDLDPRVWPATIQALLDAGADDAWVSPITMKKGRPAFTLSALCSPDSCDSIRTAIFDNTTTIGLREYEVSKYALDRRESVVHVEGQPIRVKLAIHLGTVVNRSAEWEDVAAAAEILGRPAKQVLAAAMARADAER